MVIPTHEAYERGSLSVRVGRHDRYVGDRWDEILEDGERGVLIGSRRKRRQHFKKFYVKVRE
jgi:hypothetical protein